MTQQTLLRELVSAFPKLVQLTGFSQEGKRRKNLERCTNCVSSAAILGIWEFGTLGRRFGAWIECCGTLEIQDGGFTKE